MYVLVWTNRILWRSRAFSTVGCTLNPFMEAVISYMQQWWLRKHFHAYCSFRNWNIDIWIERFDNHASNKWRRQFECWNTMFQKCFAFLINFIQDPNNSMHLDKQKLNVFWTFELNLRKTKRPELMQNVALI